MLTLTGWIKKLTDKKPTSCLACGECCRQFSWHLKVSSRDIERWQKLGRQDLLARVDDLGGIWYDTESMQRLPVCPYLVETEDNKARCGIHAIKPDICRSYPTYETYNQCIRGIHIR